MSKTYVIAALALALCVTTSVDALGAKRKSDGFVEKNIGQVLYENGHWRPWAKIASDVIALSARHNKINGQPIHWRGCIPAEKRCADIVSIALTNDGQWKWFSIIHYTDTADKTIKNEVCWFNSPKDVRQCLDYGQAGDGTIEMKGKEGWEVVQEDNDDSTPVKLPYDLILNEAGNIRSWDEIIAIALKRSGKPIWHNCDKEKCMDVASYQTKVGEVGATTYADPKTHKVYLKIVCQFNKRETVRLCYDHDNGDISRQMRESKEEGEWFPANEDGTKRDERPA